jgi:prepilin-type N-terminal cleavage/methylation domain-containing protein
MTMRQGFTLIELLIVFTIIAILAIIVILTLNPIELFRQSRDSARLSDLSTMITALGIFVTDTAGNASLGQASTTYISIPDPSATSTAGDQCQGLNLPALASGWTYQCSSPSNFKKVDGTGWIPVNFTKISSGAPFGTLPTDSTNNSSTGLYYTYTTDGQKYELTALMESTKQRSAFNLNPSSPLFPGVYAQGTSLAIAGLYNPSGFVEYWNFEEGGGSSTIDQSGNGNVGTWNGSAAGTSGYYSAGKVGKWAGTFDGSSNDVQVNIGLDQNPAWSVALWANGPTLQPANAGLWSIGGSNDVQYDNSGHFILYWGTTLVTTPVDNNQWDYWVATRNGSSFSFFKNGALVGTQSTSTTVGTNPFYVGMEAGIFYQGLIDDVRVYKRALSPGEVQAIYSAEK